jgi:hypothetical protein
VPVWLLVCAALTAVLVVSFVLLALLDPEAIPKGLRRAH